MPVCKIPVAVIPTSPEPDDVNVRAIHHAMRAIHRAAEMRACGQSCDCPVASAVDSTRQLPAILILTVVVDSVRVARSETGSRCAGNIAADFIQRPTCAVGSADDSAAAA